MIRCPKVLNNSEPPCDEGHRDLQSLSTNRLRRYALTFVEEIGSGPRMLPLGRPRRCSHRVPSGHHILGETLVACPASSRSLCPYRREGGA